MAVSLGGTGSLIEHPASSTNAGSLMDEEGRKKGGITDTLIRLRYGIKAVVPQIYNTRAQNNGLSQVMF